jgi:hypothetical protein
MSQLEALIFKTLSSSFKLNHQKILRLISTDQAELQELERQVLALLSTPRRHWNSSKRSKTWQELSLRELEFLKQRMLSRLLQEISSKIFVMSTRMFSICSRILQSAS